MDVFIGTILPFGFNFAPQGWMTCQGQLIPVSQNTALFSLLGTMYGGDGRSTFQLPDVRGRAMIGVGRGNGLSPREQGQIGGTENVTLTLNNLPSHTHTASLNPSALSGNVQLSTNTNGNATAPSASNKYLSASGGGPGAAAIWSDTLTNPVALGGVGIDGSGAVQIGNTGQSLPAPNMDPFLVMNFCIAVIGLFPPRS